MLVKDLLDNNIPYIKINDSFIVNKEYYDKTEILDLSKIKVEGEITYPSDENLLLDANCNGVMKIKDSVTLEPVDYSFSFKINENSMNIFAEITDSYLKTHFGRNFKTNAFYKSLL